MKDIFIFPAVFSKDDDGYSVYFPGIEEFPKVIDIEDIKLEKNEYVVMI